MLSIGDFAKYGRVSVRMLRHYDALGLLHPARVDPASGYRYYAAAQLSRLNRIIALRELGFSLQQVAGALDEPVDTRQLRGMLRLRRAELEAAMAADQVRLARVEARLRAIENEEAGPMTSANGTTGDVVIKSLPAVRVAQLSAGSRELAPEEIGAVIGPLFGQLCQRVAEAGLKQTGPSIAYYEELPEKPGVVVGVHAALPVAGDVEGDHDFTVTELPAVAEAATIVHHGSMDQVVTSIQQVARWVDENGYRSCGPARELYISIDGPQEEWVTEIQEPVTRA